MARNKILALPAILCALLVVVLLPNECSGQCLTLPGAGQPGYIQVKSQYDAYIDVKGPYGCTRDYSRVVHSFTITPLSFTPDTPPVTIWDGSGDLNVHTDPLTSLPIQIIDTGQVARFRVFAKSLKDLGTYTYQFQGTSTDQYGSTPPVDMQSEVFGFRIGKSHPTANLSVAGTLKVGNTITFNAAASNKDPGALHYNWVITTRPPGSVANLSNPTAAAPTMSLASKHDIGDWSVKLELADAQGELKEFTKKR